MKYIAVFNMSVYAITLSIILDMIYMGTNIFIEFNMTYFQVMYVSVSAIYLVAAIFLLKDEYIKTQKELIKIIEAQEIVKQEAEEREKEEEKKEQDEKKEDKKQKEKKQKKNDKEKNDDTNIETPEGTNA